MFSTVDEKNLLNSDLVARNIVADFAMDSSRWASIISVSYCVTPQRTWFSKFIVFLRLDGNEDKGYEQQGTE